MLPIYSIEDFLEIINSHHETFTVEEVQFLFQILKSPGSDYIDKMHCFCMQQTQDGWILKILSTTENYIRSYRSLKKSHSSLGKAYTSSIYYSVTVNVSALQNCIQ